MLAEEGRLLVEGLFLLFFRLNYYCDPSFILLLSVVLTFKTNAKPQEQVLGAFHPKRLVPVVSIAIC